MKLIKNIMLGVAALTMTATALPAQAQSSDPYPIEYWAIREVIQSVEVSPDGKHMALMKTSSKEGNPIVEIYKTDNLGEAPIRAGGGKMEITFVTWVNDKYLLVGFRAPVRKRIDGFNQGIYETKQALLNIDTKKFSEIGENLSIVGLLPKEDNKILVSIPNRAGSLIDDDPFAAFRPRSYYKVDLEKGTKTLVMRGNDEIASASFDSEGNPRLASGYDRGAREFVYYYRGPDDSSWSEVYREDSYSLETFSPAGFDENNTDIVYVVANNGNDKAGLWEFNTATKEFGELIYRRADVDVAGTRGFSNNWQNPDGIAGITYYGHRAMTEWLATEEAAQERALMEGLRQAIPNAWNVSVTATSRDGSVLTVFNNGPRDPGTYYLFKDGRLAKIGSRNPLLKSEDLADVEYIKWPSRDGTKTVHGYLTVPNGEGPFPLIVLPHGGPFVAEIVGWDEWGQFLANNGYMVLQPQYRGSLGYGLDHFISALNQGGLAMQDDKDDGALYLIEQGRVDPDRVAMFGWSYGGYAALVAGTREDNIYQCTIAGAAVADPNMQLNYYRESLIPAQEEFELRRREGIQPIDEVAKLNIPMLMIHGDVDQRVPVEHMEIYEKEVKKQGKQDMFRSVTLEGADHFYSTLFYNHQEKLYTEMLDFLQNDCGPGGL